VQGLPPNTPKGGGVGGLGIIGRYGGGGEVEPSSYGYLPLEVGPGKVL